MKKRTSKYLMGLFLLAAVGLSFALKAEAASAARGAKSSVSTWNTTNVIGISSTTAVVYSVSLSTGTAGTDYVVLFDSGAATGLTSTLQGSGGYKLRVNVSSTTQNTVVVFDPPLQFKNGIMAANSTAAITSVVTYEPGHVLNGY